ncbi:hypothetical protein Vretifemale_12891, partial [Volvox reticuliferus]
LLRLLERDPLWPPPPATQGSQANGPSQTTARSQGAESRVGVPSQSAAGGVGGAGGGAGGGSGGRVGRALVGKALLSSGAGESAVELFRMLQVYLDVSVERALGGGEQRPALMGPMIGNSVVSCVRIYLYHCMRAWEEIIILRAPPPDGATAAGHRHARTVSDRFLGAIGVAVGPGAAALPAQAAAAASVGGGGLLGSFAVTPGAAAAGLSQLQVNSAAVGRSAADLRAHAAAVMPEYGVMPAAAPGAAAVAAALSTAMTPGAGLSATAAGSVSGAGGSYVIGNVPQPMAAAAAAPPGSGPKRGHRRAATAVDADALAMSHTGGGGGGGGGTPTAAAALAALPPATALALASEPGLVACRPLVLIRNTIAAVSEGAEALEGTLGLLAPRPPIVASKAANPPGAAAYSTVAAAQRTPTESSKSYQQQKPSLSASPAAASSCSTSAAAAAAPPAFLSRATAELRHALTLASEQCLTSYHLALRGSLLRGLIAAFDLEGTRPPARAALESVLSALHDELLHVAGGVRQVAVAGAMVHSAWDAAVRCVWALALHQGGFRPLMEQEADVLREFLISLQDMFGEVVSEHLVPKAKAASASAGGAPSSASVIPPVLLTADSRAAGTAYPSALLQCVAASTEDLTNMYSAQMSCLQKMDGPYVEDDGPGIGPGGHQVSLLDLLRLLRQRRRTDPAALTFVSEQLKLAASNAKQVLFGLRANERLVATATCHLSPPVASIGPSTPGSCLSLPLGPMGAGGFRDGCLYVTSRVLGFSTMLMGDLKGTTDVTSYVKLKAVREVAKGDSPDTLLVLTHGGDLYQFCGFAPGERDRLCALINGQPTCVRIPNQPLLQTGGGTSHQNSPRRSTGAQTPPAGGGGGGGGCGGMTPSGAVTPKGLPKPPSQPSNLAAALLSAFMSTPPANATAAVANAQQAVAAVAANIPAGGGSGSAASVVGGLCGKLGKATGAATAMELAIAAAGAATAAFGTAINGSGGGGADAAIMNPGDSGTLPLLSAPCHLVNVLRNKDGMLNLYASRLDFVCATDPGVSRSMPLSHINNVSQRPAGWGGGSVLMLSVEGDKAPVLFGGIGDALLATMKQTISELCFSNG